MFRKVLVSTFIVVASAAAAQAQTPKVEFTGIIGWTLADGVTGDPFKAGNGQTYDKVEPQDSVNFGFSLGFFVNPKAEVGFLWRRQATKLDVSGTATTTVGNWNIDGYHGYGAYYFGDPEAKARLYLMGGLGATHYGSVSYTSANGASAKTSGGTQFSTDLGRRREGERLAERRDEARHPVVANLHQVGSGGMVVRPVVGLLRGRRRAVLEPV